jgi:hypothetical protein
MHASVRDQNRGWAAGELGKPAAAQPHHQQQMHCTHPAQAPTARSGRRVVLYRHRCMPGGATFTVAPTRGPPLHVPLLSLRFPLPASPCVPHDPRLPTPSISPSHAKPSIPSSPSSSVPCLAIKQHNETRRERREANPPSPSPPPPEA